MNREGGLGGGLYCRGSSPTITNCTITGNAGECLAGGIAGGGVCCWSSSPTLTSCTIAGNAAEFGGGVYCDQCFGDACSPTLMNCTIAGNVADSGGGLSCWTQCSPILTNVSSLQACAARRF